MSDGFNARNEIKFAFNNPDYQGKLTKEDIENFELDQPLFNKLSLNGAKYTLSSKGSNGEFEAVSEGKFKKFINTIAKEYGIDLDDVADDTELMFKILDKDGSGILEDSELQVLKDSDANESKSRKNKKDIIDGYTIRRYFDGIDRDVLLDEYALIEDVKNLPEDSDDMIAIKHDVDVEDIKEIRNGEDNNSQYQSIPDFVSEEQIIQYAALFDINSSTDDIKTEMQSIYRDKSAEEIDSLANKIKDMAGRRTYYDDGSYDDVIRNVKGEVTKKVYYNADGTINRNDEITYAEDGKTKIDVETKEYYDNGKIKANKHVSFAEDGENPKKVEEITYYDNGNIQESKIVTYTEDGKTLKEVEDIEYFRNGQVEESVNIQYAEDGETVKHLVKIEYEENGEVKCKTEIKRKENGEEEISISPYYY